MGFKQIYSPGLADSSYFIGGRNACVAKVLFRIIEIGITTAWLTLSHSMVMKGDEDFEFSVR